MAELGQLQKKKADFDAMGIGIVAASVDAPDGLVKAKSKTGAQFPFVSDPEGKLMDVFELRHAGASPMGGGDMARSASLLLAPDGRIVWAHYPGNYRVRPTPDQILAAAKAVFGG